MPNHLQQAYFIFVKDSNLCTKKKKVPDTEILYHMMLGH